MSASVWDWLSLSKMSTIGGAEFGEELVVECREVVVVPVELTGAGAEPAKNGRGDARATDVGERLGDVGEGGQTSCHAPTRRWYGIVVRMSANASRGRPSWV